MTYRPPRKVPQFADLKSILAQTKDTENSLYQVVQEIIERLASIQFDVTPVAPTGGGGGGGGGGNADATYLTRTNEVATLPNSAQLIARYGIHFDDSLANKRFVDLDLDYSGRYTSGPQYSDGDIVVATDNIAYLCVKPTNNPPVAWPGIGIISPPQANDATYWTVSPHSGLTAERALNTLANGYVKSTAGEPSTIAIIPISEGGTSATNPVNARTNLGIGSMGVQNANAVAITGGSITGPFTINMSGDITATNISGVNLLASNTVQIQQTNAALYLIDNSVNMMWRMFTTGAFLDFRVYNTDFTNEVILARLDRSGIFFVQFIAGNGQNLTTLNASELGLGTVPLARLGTNAPAVGTFLAWDNQWRTPSTSSGIPSGLIMLSETACPSGWSRVNWDGSFLRVNSSAGSVGGSSNHQHGAGSLITANHSHGGQTGAVNISINGNTGNGGAHSHPFSAHVAGTTGGGGGSVQTADAGGSFPVLTPPHTHSFGADIGGNTDGVGDHQHSFSGSGSGVGGIANEQVGITGNTDVQSHLPPYIDVILCRKD